jgi:hypothetical protein
MTPVLKGGTGLSNLPANKLLIGNGVDSIITPSVLHWDNSNNRLGVGTSNPRATLEVNGSIIPSACNLYDLGTTNLRWKDTYISNNLYIGYSNAYFPPPIGLNPLYAARAWVIFDGTTSPPTILGSGNVSSVSVSSTVYTINFTNTLDTDNYALVGSARRGVSGLATFTIRPAAASGVYTRNAVTVYATDSGGTAVTPDKCCVAIFY